MIHLAIYIFKISLIVLLTMIFKNEKRNNVYMFRENPQYWFIDSVQLNTTIKWQNLK